MFTNRQTFVFLQKDAAAAVEDPVAIRKHVAAMQLECQRRETDKKLLARKMAATAAYRRQQVMEKRISEILEEFPPLRTPLFVS